MCGGNIGGIDEEVEENKVKREKLGGNCISKGAVA